MNTKAICPNCGAEGTAGRFCEYCGTKIPMPKPKRKKKSDSDSDEEKRIFEFQTSEEDAVQKMLYQLTEKENLPKDFFQNCKVDDVKPYYIPVYYYQCSFEAPWSCVKLVTREYEVYNRSTGRNEKKKTTERYPMNGVAMDSFTYITCAGRKEDLPKELYEFINTEMITKGASYYDNSKVRELTNKESAILVENGGFSHDVLWKRNCEGLLAARVGKTVRSQLPDRYEDLSYSYSYNNPCWDMILPFWVVYYSYQGKKFVFVTDGLVNTTRLYSPVDEKQASESESIKKDLAQKSSKSGWSIFYFILFSLATLITSIFLTESDISFWCLLLSIIFMILTLINGSKTKKRLREKKKAQAVQTKYLNEAWLQRKKQLSSTLTHNSFGITEAKAKELLNSIKREVERKDMSVDSNANCLWVKLITYIVLIIWGITLVVGVRTYTKHILQERQAEIERMEKAEMERKAIEAQKYEKEELLKRISRSAITDLQKLALPDSIKEIRRITDWDSISYKFTPSGYLTKIEAYRLNYNEFHIYNFNQGKLVSSKDKEDYNDNVEYKTYEEEKALSIFDDDNNKNTLYAREGIYRNEVGSIYYDERGRIIGGSHSFISSSGDADFVYDNKGRATDGNYFVLPLSVYTPYPLFIPSDLDEITVTRQNGKIVLYSTEDKYHKRMKTLYTFIYWNKQAIEQEQQRISIQNEMMTVDDSVAVASPADSLATD
jgi:hypothetical protein